MATTQNTYTGDGSTVLFSFTFPYLDTTDIKVSLNGTNTTAYTLANATQVRFNTAPANGAAIRIYRKTNTDTLKAEFYPGSAIRAQDLNEDFTQNLYVTQESAVDVAAADAKSDAAMQAAGDAIITSAEAKATAEGAAAVSGSAIQKADAAVATANTANNTANNAVITANAADAKATTAINSIAGSIQYVPVANVSAIPSNPIKDDAIEVADSTGIQGFSPLSGLPAGFVGSSGLRVRLQYNGSSWNYLGYQANDSDARYVINTTTGDPKQSVAISTNGTGRLFVDASGNVGVGTATANAPLTVAELGAPGAPVFRFVGKASNGNYMRGSWFASDNTTQLAQLAVDGTAAMYLGTVSSTPLVFTTASTERMRLDSSGRLGLGVSAPDNKLSVGIASADEGIELKATYNGSRVARFGLLNPGVDNTPYIGSVVGNDFGFITSGTRRMTLDSTGRLGIGTNAPEEKLTITDGLIRLNSTTATSRHVLFYDTAGLRHVIGSDATAGTNEFGIRSEGQIVFGAGSGRGEAARIDSSKRLLVGTSTSPSAGDGQYARFVLQGNTIANSAYLSLQRSQAATTIIAGHDLGNIGFNDNSGNTFARIEGYADGTAGANDYPGRLVFSTTADGASSPTERGKFGSDGYIYCYQSYTGTTAIAANLVVLSNGAFLRSSSSAKYKTQIEDLQDQYADALLQCRPVWYRSTCQADNPNHGWWGFIAEEVAAIDPRLVHWKTVEITYDEKGSAVETSCDPEPEGVAYDRFVPHLLNLIKRQKEQIEAMETRLSALEGA